MKKITYLSDKKIHIELRQQEDCDKLSWVIDFLQNNLNKNWIFTPSLTLYDKCLILYDKWSTKTDKYHLNKLINIYNIGKPKIFSYSETICLFYYIKFNNKSFMDEKNFI